MKKQFQLRKCRASLALATCLSNKDIKYAISLAKEALKIDPNYVDYKYRGEQLWGEKLQKATKKLFESSDLRNEIISAKSKINNRS